MVDAAVASPASLAAVERDLQSGNLGKARERLHGLISTYPDDLSLRRKLGEVYWALQYPAMAGRYWYLEAEKTPDMAAACAAFERSCGGDPLQIWRALKFRGTIDAIRQEHAGRVLLDLQAKAAVRPSYFLGIREPGIGKSVPPGGRATGGNRLLLAGCILAGLAALGLMAIGIITVVARLAG